LGISRCTLVCQFLEALQLISEVDVAATVSCNC
jgi:hypothetical protein